MSNVSVREHHEHTAETEKLRYFDEGYWDGLRGFFNPPEQAGFHGAIYREGYSVARAYLGLVSDPVMH